MAHETATDDRSTDLKIKMALHFDEREATYREGDNHSIVYEDSQVTIVADHTGHELDEWARERGLDRDDLRETMRVIAEDVMGEQDAHEAFSQSDPLVFDALEGDA